MATKHDAQANTEGYDDLIPQTSKGKKIATIIINTILIIAIIMAALCTYLSYVSTSGSGVPSLFGVRIMSIQTESMYPTLEPGDMIFDTAVKDTSTLQIGDIITYWTVIDGERALNTHRITEIYDGGNNLRIFRTKGDNNTADDSLTVHESEIVGQYNGSKIAGLGKVFDYLRTSSGFLIVVVIPVAIFFIYHLIQFFRVLFEYNNVKNKLRYEQERGKTEDLVENEKQHQEELRKAEREKLEAELREKLRAEILGSAGVDAEKADGENKPAKKKKKKKSEKSEKSKKSEKSEDADEEKEESVKSDDDEDKEDEAESVVEEAEEEVDEDVDESEDEDDGDEDGEETDE